MVVLTVVLWWRICVSLTSQDRQPIIIILPRTHYGCSRTNKSTHLLYVYSFLKGINQPMISHRIFKQILVSPPILLSIL